MGLIVESGGCGFESWTTFDIRERYGDILVYSVAVTIKKKFKEVEFRFKIQGWRFGWSYVEKHRCELII